jgi:rubrerythrin
MEATQRRTASSGDPSDSEGEVEVKQEGEVAAEDAANERLIKAIARMSSKTKMDIPTYEGNLDEKELLD